MPPRPRVLAVATALLAIVALAPAVQAAPKMYSGSLVLHAFANDTTKETELNNMMKREEMRNLHKRVKRDLKDDYRSNVYFVEVPNDNLPPRQSKQWSQVREAEAMYREILKYSETHYSMAQQTPFGSGARAAGTARPVQ